MFCILNWPTDKPGKVSNLDVHTETDNGQAQDKLGKASISPTPLRPIFSPRPALRCYVRRKETVVLGRGHKGLYRQHSGFR